MKNLITILCLCLFWGSCESPTEIEPNEVDVDWILIKDPSFCNPGMNDTFTGYLLLLDDYSDEFDESIFTFTGDKNQMSFIYNDESFSFNISDGVCYSYYGHERIIFNQDMNYLTILNDEDMYGYDLSPPTTIIDFR